MLFSVIGVDTLSQFIVSLWGRDNAKCEGVMDAFLCVENHKFVGFGVLINQN